MAAEHGHVQAVVSLAGAGRPFDEVLNEQAKAAVVAGDLSADAAEALRLAYVELRAGRHIATQPAHIPNMLWRGLFAPRAQDYLISLFRYDPAVEIAKLAAQGVPLLIVQGTSDLMGGRADPEGPGRPM